MHVNTIFNDIQCYSVTVSLYNTLGPSMFLPIHKIYRRCIACSGRLVLSETTHGINSSTDEVVMFVSPLPSLQNF